MSEAFLTFNQLYIMANPLYQFTGNYEPDGPGNGYIVNPSWNQDDGTSYYYASLSDQTNATVNFYGDYYDSEDNLIEADSTNQRFIPFDGEINMAACLSALLDGPLSGSVPL